MADAPNVTVDLAYDAIRVKFGGALHLHVKRSQLLGIQSWRHGQNNYFIEFTMAGAVITSDYDDEAKWKAILAGLEKVL